MIANLRQARAAKAAAQEAKTVQRASVRASWGQVGGPLTPRGSGGGAASGEQCTAHWRYQGSQDVSLSPTSGLLPSPRHTTILLNTANTCLQVLTVVPPPLSAGPAAHLLQEHQHQLLQVCPSLSSKLCLLVSAI
jgi:hypothetical protein